MPLWFLTKKFLQEITNYIFNKKCILHVFKHADKNIIPYWESKKLTLFYFLHFSVLSSSFETQEVKNVDKLINCCKLDNISF
jgi:hypothetical protein